MADEEVGETEVLRYAGRRLNSEDKTLYAYAGLDGEVGFWKKQLVRPAPRIGAAYVFTRSPSGGVYTGGDAGPRYSADDSLDHLHPSVVTWKARDLEAEDVVNRLAAIRKAGDPFTEIEGLIGRAAIGLTKPQRRALASRLLEALYL